MKPDFITKMRLHALMCLFILLPFVASGQQMTITGTVVDEFGEALPGVTVFIDGTTRGVSTDIDGKYSISASPGEVLVFSSVGMNTRKITVGAEGSHQCYPERSHGGGLNPLLWWVTVYRRRRLSRSCLADFR